MGDQTHLKEFNQDVVESNLQRINHKIEFYMDWPSFLSYQPSYQSKGREVTNNLSDSVSNLIHALSGQSSNYIELIDYITKNKLTDFVRGVVVIGKAPPNGKQTFTEIPIDYDNYQSKISTGLTEIEYDERHKVILIYKNVRNLQHEYDQHLETFLKQILKVTDFDEDGENKKREDYKNGWNFTGLNLIQVEQALSYANQNVLDVIYNVKSKWNINVVIDWPSFFKLATEKSELSSIVLYTICDKTLTELNDILSPNEIKKFDFQPAEQKLFLSEVSTIHIQCTPRDIACKFPNHRPFFEDVQSVQKCDHLRLEFNKTKKQLVIHFLPDKFKQFSDYFFAGYPSLLPYMKIVWGLYWASEQERDDWWENSKMCYTHTLTPAKRSLTTEGSSTKVVHDAAPSTLPRKVPTAQSGVADPSVVPPNPPVDDDDDDDDDYDESEEDYATTITTSTRTTAKIERAPKPEKPKTRRCPHCFGKGIVTCICSTPKHCKKCAGSKKHVCTVCKGKGELRT
ncbi:hypothetical protein AKO1_005822 [Acrasis kona]|uniref:Uncharacterized protein n=1 Tax=Acrasis kona TaxID=1008807 RepID=A0AAW2YL82_9EUKA